VRIELTSIFVDDQEKALNFYTAVLGFIKKQDIPVGDARWLTVVSPEDPDGPQLVLEPNGNPAALAYQQSLFEQSIPITAFAVADIHEEYERLRERSVVFNMDPTDVGEVIIAVFEDTCGNLIQIYQTTA
jgi:predicted enzyme related to lactoylglutathione lyase